MGLSLWLKNRVTLQFGPHSTRSLEKILRKKQRFFLFARAKLFLRLKSKSTDSFFFLFSCKQKKKWVGGQIVFLNTNLAPRAESEIQNTIWPSIIEILFYSQIAFSSIFFYKNNLVQSMTPLWTFLIKFIFFYFCKALYIMQEK